MRLSTSRTPSSTGSAPPERPEPAPRATQATFSRAHALHDRDDLLGAVGQHGGRGRRVVLEQPVGLVGAQLVLGRVDPVVADDPAQFGDQLGDVSRRLARCRLDLRGALGRCLYTTIHDNTAVDWR